MKIVKCSYCQKPMRDFYDRDYTRLNYKQCDYHGAVRVRHMDQPTGGHTISLVIIYKEQLYFMNFHHDVPFVTNTFQIHKARRWPNTIEVVMSLEFHPAITPDNAAQKLPTMILFS